MSTDATLHDEVVALTRDLIRLDTTNAPGNETRAAERALGVQVTLDADDRTLTVDESALMP